MTLRTLPVLAVLALLLVGASAGTIQREQSPFRLQSDSTTSGDPAPSTTENNLPQDSTNEWMLGWWDIDRSGFDPTMMYDERSRQTGPALAVAGSTAETVAVAEQFIRYQYGWASAAFTFNTTVTLTAQDATDSDLVEQAGRVFFEPGNGWFLGVDAEPGDLRTEKRIGSDVEWTRQAGEYLHVTTVKHPNETDAECLPYERSFKVLEEGTGSSSHLEAKLQDQGDSGLSSELFRSDKLILYVNVPEFIATCTYQVRVEWNLQFVFEAPAPPLDQSAFGERPIYVPVQEFGDWDTFVQETNVLGIHDYQTFATLKVSNSNGTGSDRSDEGSPLEVRVFYAPVMPVEWTCSNVPTQPDCTTQLLSCDEYDNTVRMLLSETPDVPGLVINTVECWAGNAALSNHIILDNELDLRESMVYYKQAAGNITETPFLSAT